MAKKECSKCKVFKESHEYKEKTHYYCKECLKIVHIPSSNDPYAQITKTKAQMEHFKEVRQCALTCWEVNLKRFETSECDKQNLINYLDTINLLDEEILRDPQFRYEQRKELFKYE